MGLDFEISMFALSWKMMVKWSLLAHIFVIKHSAVQVVFSPSNSHYSGACSQIWESLLTVQYMKFGDNSQDIFSLKQWHLDGDNPFLSGSAVLIWYVRYGRYAAFVSHLAWEDVIGFVVFKLLSNLLIYRSF